MLTFESYEAAVEQCFANGWTDGLPVVPPTPGKVRAFLATVPRRPDEPLPYYAERGRVVTVEKVAVNAVMAGCLPEYFPVVLAIADVLFDPDLDFHAAHSSTGGVALGWVLNGPIRRAIGANAQGNVLGPGNRANSTIGRAIRLLQINAMGSVPGAGHDDSSPLEILDRSTLGQPAKYACFHVPEHEEAEPSLAPLHVERGFRPEQNVVTVFATGGGMQVSLHADQTAAEIAESIGDHLLHLGRHDPTGWLVLVLTPEAARLVARNGWSKARLREAVFDGSTRHVGWFREAGLSVVGHYYGARRNPPPQPDDDERLLTVTAGPDDVQVVVAGGPAGAWAYFLVPYGPIASKAF